MAKLVEIEGIGESYAQKLREAGIETTELLLEKGATPEGRNELASITGISEQLILNWVSRVEFFRIKGVGEEYADLLEAAGIDTLRELAYRNPENLYSRLVEVNKEKMLVRRLPNKSQLYNWVEQARALPRVITY